MRTQMTTALVLAPAALALAATSASAACPNEAIRAAQGAEVLALPECMALEQVSPAQKFNAAARGPQIAVGGERLRFDATAALAGAPSLADPKGDVYLATRGGTGWEIAPTRAPAALPSGWGVFAAARMFSPDFASWFHVASTPAQYAVGVARAYRVGTGGLFEPLSPLLEPTPAQVLASGSSARSLVGSSRPAGATADHSRLYLQPGRQASVEATYLSGDPVPGGSGFDKNTYVARLEESGLPGLALMARDDEDRAWGGRCGARLGGIGNSGTAQSDRNQGALSTDGTRALISARPGQAEGTPCDAGANKLRILVRSESAQGISIAPLYDSQCNRVAPPCKGSAEANGDDRFQGASVDQSKVYFTTNRQLASSDLDGTNEECRSAAPAVSGCDLYLYDEDAEPGQELIQVSAGESGGGHEAGADARVYDGTVAISGDGSHAYFAAEGVLTTAPGPKGESADELPASTPKLYLYQRDEAHPNGRIAFIGALDPGDRSNGTSDGLWGGGNTWRFQGYPVPATGKDPEGEEVGGDGHILVFLSQAPLTADDTDGTRRDAFRYDAHSGELLCVSCRGGGPDAEPFAVVSPVPFASSVPPGTDFAEEGRWASEDGGSIVFKTAESLAAGDDNGELDSYLWQEGSFHRLPGTSAPSDAAGQLRDIPVLSHDGSTVAFTSAQQLLPSDIDSAVDTYVARVGGGFPELPEPPPCDPSVAGACRAALSAAPAAAQPGSEGFVGPEKVAADSSCTATAAARRARALAARAKRLRHAARRVESPDEAKRMRRAAKRSARQARRLADTTKRCRAELRRSR